MDKQTLEAKLRSFVGQETGPSQVGPDRVNEAMIRHWCEAMGDTNPIYTDEEAAKQSVHGGLVAPPTMLQAWSMRGMSMAAPPDPASRDRQLALHDLLGEAGYPSVVATNCEQGYTRYLRPGDQVVAHTVVEAISEEKATALGIGYFIDTRTTFRDQRGEEVGWMTFRVLKFKAAQPAPAAGAEGGAAAPAKPRRLRPPLGHDNRWWWEGIAAGELRIQRCKDCGVLRHPPRPMCGSCQSLAWDWVVSKGAGTVYSYVVMHHPPIPGYDFPLAVALIELDEGTRLVANVAGVPAGEVRVGMRVQARIEDADEEMKLPFFHPVDRTR
jgi:uncharacterized OB-fold protein/acyl dehydratase